MKNKTTTKLFSTLIATTFFFNVFSQEIVLDSAQWVKNLKKNMEPKIIKKMKSSNIVGISIAVFDSTKIVWAQGFGFADLQKNIPATALTVYRIGSISKLFTATATMQLHEKSIIDIDKPYKQYVPELTIKSHFKNQPEFTTRNMMTHHSGIPSDVAKGLLTKKAENYKEVIKYLNEDYLCFPPNYILSYSNAAVSLVGYLVEKMSNTPFEQYIEKNILLPLGMNNSGFYVNKEMEKLHSKGYKRGKEEKDVEIREVPAGMMASNVIDICKFIEMVINKGSLNGNTIIKSATLDEMFTRQNANVKLDFNTEIGLGWFLNPKEFKKVGKVVEHGGDTELFHAYLCILLEKKLGVIVMTNSREGGSVKTKLTNDIIFAALKEKEGKNYEIPKDSNKIEIVKTDKNNANQWEGTYPIIGGVLNFKMKANKLKAKFGIQKITLLPNNKGTYTPKITLFHLISIKIKDQQFSFKNIDGETVFVVNDNALAKKITPKPITKEWKARLGKYVVINAGDDLYYPEKIELKIDKDDLLVIKLKFFGGSLGFMIDILDEKNGIMAGLGRMTSGTIQSITDEGGEEILLMMGYKIKKIK